MLACRVSFWKKIVLFQYACRIILYLYPMLYLCFLVAYIFWNCFNNLTTIVCLCIIEGKMNINCRLYVSLHSLLISVNMIHQLLFSHTAGLQPWTFVCMYLIFSFFFVAGSERRDMGSLYSWCTFPCQGDHRWCICETFYSFLLRFMNHFPLSPFYL